MDDIVVSNEGVNKLLKGLNPSKALGPDELHPRVLKELATELGPVLPISSKSLLTRVKSPKNGRLQSKKISNDQELIQSDPISCPQNQKGNN